MNQQTINNFFGKEHAKHYDARWQHMAPVNAALHLIMRAAFLPLPARARLLCVGAGTGAEVLAMAQAFPGWHITAVEPSGAMLDICREKAQAAGVSQRCAFHEGFLETLPETEPFDAATSILVSQFLTDPTERLGFFRGIERRLKPGGSLFTVDIASRLEADAEEALYQVWLRFTSGQAEVSGSIATSPWRKDLAVSKPLELEALIRSAGFAEVLPIYQAVFIHGWLARKP